MSGKCPSSEGSAAQPTDRPGVIRHNRSVAKHSEPEETRIDRWLCAVRLVKTRPIATQLCEGGHVLVNGVGAKPSTKVRPGDEVHARIAERDRIVEVVRPIETRLGAAAVADCYVDRSPPPPPRELGPSVKVHRGEDWANKRFRRELDRMRRGSHG
jgi:ribosome-associated heat shock protein Hsp15